MTRRWVDAGVPWAVTMGYSRGVRVGNVIEVAGTAAAAPDGGIVGPGDVGMQTRAILEKVGEALEELGGGFSDVVRTRIFLRDPVNDWEAAARVHGEVFADVRPANTTVGATFVHPDMLVEIEVTAIVDDG
jgi:enamine deaminase RidA (YjgF/YER057c/UK114 family)